MKNTDTKDEESQYQSKNNIKKELWSWITDGEKRSTLNWISLFIGGGFIVGYYLSLDVSFTPNIDLGQATLLLIQAFLLGIFLVGYLCTVAFGPAIAYRWLGMGEKLFAKDIPPQIKKSLFLRNFTAQVLFAAQANLLVLTVFSEDGMVKWTADLIVVVIAALVSLVILVSRRPVRSEDIQESWWDFIGSILLVGCLGVVSFFVVWMIHAIPHQEASNGSWWLYVMWLAVAVFSATFSIVNNHQWGTAFVFAISGFFLILATFNVVSWPVKTIATAIGIAERDPVTLIFPEGTCKTVAKAVSKSSLLCDGDQSGVLHNVLLRNSLGERWVMQEAEGTQSVIFDGKGVVVVKPPKAGHQSKADAIK